MMSWAMMDELIKARADELRAEAARDRLVPRRPGRVRRLGGSLWLALGVRLVSAGSRLLGETPEVN